MTRIFRIQLIALLIGVMASTAHAKISTLIIEGQNNHGVWPKTSKMMKSYLEETGLFTVDIVRTIARGTDPDFKPEFKKYDLVVSNYNGSPWPEETKKAFVEYVNSGGGFVVVHAANNSFAGWKEYNEIIGLGGWGGRTEKSGPYIYIKDDKLVRDESPGRGGNHGSQHPFVVTVRNSKHPITKGMPGQWLHVKDELYDLLRGPAENMKVLATAYASKDFGGQGRHEPMIFTVNYGEGRVFHTPMGHGDYSQECVGFIASFQRGAEWAATGKVSQKIPSDFPTADDISQRKYEEK